MPPLKVTLFLLVYFLFQSLASAQGGQTPFYLRLINSNNKVQEDTVDKNYLNQQPIKIESNSTQTGLNFICILQPESGIAHASFLNNNQLSQEVLSKIMEMKKPIRLTIMVRDSYEQQPDKKYAALQILIK